jgi:serine/threonine-protein kinase
MANLKPGDRISAYELRREIGQGAMATVFEAEHTTLGKRVALKRMHPHLATDSTAASRFLREGRAAAQIVSYLPDPSVRSGVRAIRSPHVVDVFDVGTHDGVPYLVMELLDGEDLASALRHRGRLPLREVADIVVPIAHAVHMAHDAGVIHRDLKPSNVVLARRDDGGVCPVVLDFGISKIVTDADRDLTASEVLLGTVHYMSPEQTRSGRQATALSDQYALGVLLYECATGGKPFAGSTPYAVMHAIVSARVAPPSTIDPALPAAFDDVVLRAMHRDPRKRFGTVRALGAALLPWASEATRSRYGGMPAVEPGAHAARRRGARRWAVVLACGAVAVAVLAAAKPSARWAPQAATTVFASAPSLRSGLRPQVPSDPDPPAETQPARDEPHPSASPSGSIGPGSRTLEESGPERERGSRTLEESGPERERGSRTPAPPPPEGGSARRRSTPTAPSSAAAPERGTNGALILE